MGGKMESRKQMMYFICNTVPVAGVYVNDWASEPFYVLQK